MPCRRFVLAALLALASGDPAAAQTNTVVILNGAPAGNAAHPPPPAPATQAALQHPPLPTSPAPSDAEMGGRVPKIGHHYRGSVPYLGRDLPLPDGDWILLVREVVYARPQPDPTKPVQPPRDHIALVRRDNGVLTGLIEAFGNPDGKPSPIGWPLDAICGSDTVIRSDVRKADPRGDQDCMAVNFINTTRFRDAGAPRFLRSLAVGLDGLNLLPPAIMVGVVIAEADPTHLLTVSVFLNPDAAGITPDHAVQRARSDWASFNLPHDPAKLAYVEKLEAWGRRWRDVMRQQLSNDRVPVPADAAVTP